MIAQSVEQPEMTGVSQVRVLLMPTPGRVFRDEPERGVPYAKRVPKCGRFEVGADFIPWSEEF